MMQGRPSAYACRAGFVARTGYAPRVGCCTRLYTRPSALVFVISSSTSTIGLSPSSLRRRVTVSPAIGSATVIVASVELLLSPSRVQSSRIASPCHVMPSSCSDLLAGPQRSQQMKWRLVSGLAPSFPEGATLRMNPPRSATSTAIAPLSRVTVFVCCAAAAAAPSRPVSTWASLRSGCRREAAIRRPPRHGSLRAGRCQARKTFARAQPAHFLYLYEIALPEGNDRSAEERTTRKHRLKNTHFRMLRLPLLAALVAAAAASAPCATDEDCSLNGVCTAGTCVCDKGWVSADHTGKGTHAGGCGLLDFKPAPSSVSFHGLDDKKSSWGGSILQLPVSGTPGKTQYAMFAAEMTHDCTLRHWTTNSEVVLAVADEPTGPYKEEFQIIPPWCATFH
jgi:hypothetical protein